MNKKIELTNTYVDCRSWSVEDKIKYMKLCIGNDLPHSKICGWASYSLDSLIDIYSKCTFIYFDGSMLSQDQCETPVLMSGRNLVSLDEILRAAALEERKPRTKVEYVRINVNDDGGKYCECAKEWAENESPNIHYEIGGSYLSVSDNKILLEEYNNRNLYRRIETPITEREAFVEALQELWIIDGVDGKEQMDKIVDSGLFKLVN